MLAEFQKENFQSRQLIPSLLSSAVPCSLVEPASPLESDWLVFDKQWQVRIHTQERFAVFVLGLMVNLVKMSPRNNSHSKVFSTVRHIQAPDFNIFSGPLLSSSYKADLLALAASGAVGRVNSPALPATNSFPAAPKRDLQNKLRCSRFFFSFLSQTRTASLCVRVPHSACTAVSWASISVASLTQVESSV